MHPELEKILQEEHKELLEYNLFAAIHDLFEEYGIEKTNSVVRRVLSDETSWRSGND